MAPLVSQSHRKKTDTELARHVSNTPRKTVASHSILELHLVLVMTESKQVYVNNYSWRAQMTARREKKLCRSGLACTVLVGDCNIDTIQIQECDPPALVIPSMDKNGIPCSNWTNRVVWSRNSQEDKSQNASTNVDEDRVLTQNGCSWLNHWRPAKDCLQ